MGFVIVSQEMDCWNAKHKILDALTFSFECLKKPSTGLLCFYFHFLPHELINRLQTSLGIEKTFNIKAIANGLAFVNETLKIRAVWT